LFASDIARCSPVLTRGHEFLLPPAMVLRSASLRNSAASRVFIRCAMSSASTYFGKALQVDRRDHGRAVRQRHHQIVPRQPDQRLAHRDRDMPKRSASEVSSSTARVQVQRQDLVAQVS
jgi:hypothetical protein